jgi:hypothetical protein
MNADTLRGLIGADPFQPFTLRLAIGRLIKVPHRSFVTISADGRSFTIFGGGATGTIETILLENCELDGGKPAA